jgi:protein required for attachment to host cells
MTMKAVESSRRDAPGSAIVLVGDHARVRLFAVPTPGAPLQEIEDLVNPSARQHEGDIVTDQSGRLGMSSQVGSGNTAGTANDAKKHEADLFAKRASDRLSALLNTGAFRRIGVIAEPGFLGLLRRHLTPAAHRAVVAEIPKSMTSKPPAEIRAQLPKAI